MDILKAVDTLIAKAEASRRLPMLSAERSAELLLQHVELLDCLREMRAFHDGHVRAMQMLSEPVRKLDECYYEVSPNEFRIAPRMSQKFKPRLASLLRTWRDLSVAVKPEGDSSP